MDLFALPEHPAAQLFPVMHGDELRELADDIKTNGLRSPIVVLDKMGEQWILDGRNRLRACKLAGVEPTHTLWLGADPIAYVTSVNLHRRHLVDSQLAILAVEIEKLYATEAKRRQKSGKGIDGSGGRGRKRNLPADMPESDRSTGESRTRAADQVGVSPRLVQAAKRVVTSAAPEVTAAVQAGKVTVSDAVRIVDQPVETQVELVAKVAEGEARTLTEALKAMRSDIAETDPEPEENAPESSEFTVDGELETVWLLAMNLSHAALVELRDRLGRFLEAAA